MGDRIKFYLDEHVPRAVTEGLRRRGVDAVVDAVTVQDLGLRGAGDVQHIERAIQEHRVIVTQDADFLRLHALGIAHGGIVYASQQASISRMLRALMLVHDLLKPTDMACHVEFL